MAPGVFHCAGGTGPQVFDMFGARWVENGTAPTGSSPHALAAASGRGLCAYPYVARYDGKGAERRGELRGAPNSGPQNLR